MMYTFLPDNNHEYPERCLSMRFDLYKRLQVSALSPVAGNKSALIEHDKSRERLIRAMVYCENPGYSL